MPEQPCEHQWHCPGTVPGAVHATQRLLSGRDVRVPRALLGGLLTLLREAVRLLEAGLDEASTRPPGDGSPTE